MSYTATDYARERAICNAAAAYARATMAARGPRCNYLTADEAKVPVYAACNNEMRGRVEQYELLRDLPDRFVAYLATGAADHVGALVPVQVWTGDTLGTAQVMTVGARANQYGERQRYGRATIGGATYAWQGPGAGMYATFRRIADRKPIARAA